MKRKKKPAKKKSTKKKPNLTAFAKATKKFGKKKLSKLVPQKTKPRVDPLWTLEDGVTYSVLSKFLKCRQRFHIGEVQGWKPKGLNFPLEFGNIFHHMVEAQDRGILIENMERIANNYVNQKIKEENPGPDKIKELTILAGVATVTFEQYVAYWVQNPSITLTVKGTEKHFYEKNFSWVGKEIAFEVPYTLPNGRKIKLKGKKDGKFKLNRKLSGNWVLETKTKGRIDEDGITNGLHKDMQTGMYCTADMIESKTPPKGVLYNVIRRTQLKPKVNEPATVFIKRVEDDIMKRPHWYFMRWSREISEQEIEDFRRRQLNPALFQLIQWWDSIARNPMHPFRTTCDCVTDGSLREFGDCKICEGAGVVDNLQHYERPFGSYDAMSNTERGDYFEIVTDNDYRFYEQKKHTFPELAADDDLDQYLVGVDD